MSQQPNATLGTAERSFVHWDALLAIVRGAAIPGGALAGITLVEAVAPPEQNQFPCVGIGFSDFQETKLAPNRRQVISTFDVVVAVRVDFNPVVPADDTTARALAALRPFVNDGLGNGMSPLLRSQTQLGGACVSSYITSMRYLVGTGSPTTATTIASAVYSFVTEDHIAFRP